MSGHVFISYRHHLPDSDYAEALATFLASAGIPVWFDHQLITGDRWHEVIRENIGSCAALVVIMTPYAETSRWVNREIEHADRIGKPILPLLLAGDRFFRLSDIQYEDVSAEQMPPLRFVTRLRGLLPNPPTLARVINADAVGELQRRLLSRTRRG